MISFLFTETIGDNRTDVFRATVVPEGNNREHNDNAVEEGSFFSISSESLVAVAVAVAVAVTVALLAAVAPEGNNEEGNDNVDEGR